MKPIEFEEVNVVYGANQKEYIPLPCHRTPEGEATMCMQLSEEELKQVQETGHIWVTLLTFNQALQPILLSSTKPVDLMGKPTLVKDYYKKSPYESKKEICPECGDKLAPGMCGGFVCPNLQCGHIRTEWEEEVHDGE